MQVGTGYYKIVNRLNAMVLESKEDGLVKQGTDNTSSANSQQWRFIPTDPVSIGYPLPDQRTIKGRYQESMLTILFMILTEELLKEMVLVYRQRIDFQWRLSG